MPTLILPCAGSGTRLGNSGPKTLVQVGGKSIISRILENVGVLFDEIVIVTRPQDLEEFQSHLKLHFPDQRYLFAIQEKPSGSIDAIYEGMRLATSQNDLVIIWGDQVGVSFSTVSRLLNSLAQQSKTFSMPIIGTKYPYVWLNLSEDGRIESACRYRDGDTSPEYGYADLGVFGLTSNLRKCFFSLREDFENKPDREHDFIYLLPQLAMSADRSEIFETFDKNQLLGVNTPEELARANELYA